MKISLGTVQFGLNYGIGSNSCKVHLKEVKEILDYAVNNNINTIDTAPSYGDSEQVLGRLGVDSFNVVTKTRNFNSSDIGFNELRLFENDFNASLNNLNKEHIYGLLVHNADDLLKPGSKVLFNKINRLKQDGKVKKIGVSVYDNSQLQSIIDNFDIDLVQLPFNILDRRMIDSGMLVTLRSKGIEVHARSVFLQGLFLMSDKNRPNKFNRWSGLWKIWYEWLNDNQITALEATIRHAVSMPEISKVLVGVYTVDQLKEIFIASSGVLPKVPDELYTNDVDLLNPSNWKGL